MKHRLWRYLIAIIVGNAIYFGVEHLLPPRAQHQPYHIDWGLAVDFWKDYDELRANWGRDKEWQPAMDSEQRKKLYSGWKKAVTRTFDWVE